LTRVYLFYSTINHSVILFGVLQRLSMYGISSGQMHVMKFREALPIHVHVFPYLNADTVSYSIIPDN
jgi:hypothetical protein